jgi:hypothetical protein
MIRGSSLTLGLGAAVVDSPTRLARLVGEEGSQRRDDGNESSRNEVGDYGLNVLVRARCFLVKEVA